MATLDHGSTTIADSYARALLSLAEEAQCADEIHDIFRDIVAEIERDDAFATFMMSAVIDDDRRAAMMETHFRGKMPDLLLNTLQIVNQKGRCELLPLIYEQYRLVLEELRNEVDVHVTSAVDLTDNLRTQLAEVATKVAGKTARLVENVDPAILGGLVVRIGDEKLDSSVSRQLEQIRDVFEERASREIHSGKAFFESAE